MISDQNIRDYYEVVSIGAVDEDTIEVFRNILYNKIEKESKTNATQELWEMYIRLMRRLKRNNQTKHGWSIEDSVIKERLKYKGLIYEKNKDDGHVNVSNCIVVLLILSNPLYFIIIIIYSITLLFF